MPGWRSGSRSTFVRGLLRGFEKHKDTQRFSAGSTGSAANGLAAGPMLPRARPGPPAAQVEPAAVEGSPVGKPSRRWSGSGYLTGGNEGSQVSSQV